MIENVQIRATKVADGLRNLSYTERLSKLDLPTLVYRSTRGDLIAIYKHFNSYFKATLFQSFQPNKRRSRNTQFPTCLEIVKGWRTRLANKFVLLPYHPSMEKPSKRGCQCSPYQRIQNHAG